MVQSTVHATHYRRQATLTIVSMIVYKLYQLHTIPVTYTHSRQHTVEELTESIPISFRVLVNDSANSILFIGSIPIVVGHMIYSSSNIDQ